MLRPDPKKISRQIEQLFYLSSTQLKLIGHQNKSNKSITHEDIHSISNVKKIHGKEDDDEEIVLKKKTISTKNKTMI
jgi:hypothetical protein